MERLGEHWISRVDEAIATVEGTDQQPVCGRDIAVALEQERGRGDCGLQGSFDLGIPATEVREDERGVAKVAGNLGADVRGRRDASLAIRVSWAQLRCASQRLDTPDGVATGEDSRCGGLEVCRDGFVGSERRLGEMPGPAIGLVCPDVGQRAMSGSSVFGPRQLHDRRAEQRVSEREAVGSIVQVSDACLFRGREITRTGARVAFGFEDADVPGAIERDAQQEATRGSRKPSDLGSEQRLEPAAKRQREGQGAGGRARPGSQPDRELDERQRVALRLEEDPIACGRPEVRAPRFEQLPGGASVQRLHHQFRDACVVEDVVFARARCRQQADLGAFEAPRNKAKDGGARAVQPR